MDAHSWMIVPQILIYTTTPAVVVENLKNRYINGREKTTDDWWTAHMVLNSLSPCR